MANNLVVVESPAKANTIKKYLGSGYDVKASIGHIRDLPKNRLGVDVANGFAPRYEVPPEKKEVVRALKEAAAKAKAVYLATDPDREGEAISWHIAQEMNLDGKPAHRVVFHEITESAIRAAFANPREIDMRLVEAQQARRILDRLVGYEISPLLWRKVRRGLSAGRVQSVAVRLVVEREREIEAFKPVEYWSIEAELAKEEKKAATFRAALVGLFGPSPFGKGQKLSISTEAEASDLMERLEPAAYSVAKVSKKEVRRQPSPPFVTSTLQQEAWRKLGFDAKRTMRVAQQLYEGLPLGDEGNVGLITYMRTDSVQVSSLAIAEMRDYIQSRFGAAYLPPAPRVFRTKSKGAQEAHEAIRPTAVRREPAEVRRHLTPDQLRLYQLIWRRALASQMAAALFDSTSVDVRAVPPAGGQDYLFRATASVLRFPGFIAVYGEESDEVREEDKRPLPELAQGEPLRLLKLVPEQHFTEPPPRYNEATLVKTLEEKGIGRPSTYAPIISTIQERGYVSKVERYFRPTGLGCVVNDLLVEHFPGVVDVGFTAQMEEGLDEVARGEREWVPLVQRFYEPLREVLSVADRLIERVKVPDEVTDEVCERCGRPMVVKLGRYGRFLSCSGYPECKNSRPIVAKVGAACPQCGGEMVRRKTKKGKAFYGCSRYPQCTFVLWKRPAPQACSKCGSAMTFEGRARVKCLKCGQVEPKVRGAEPKVRGVEPLARKREAASTPEG